MPILGFDNKSGPQRISLDVTTDNKEVVVILDWKALVPLLVNMAHTACVVMSVITHRMRSADPTHESAHLAVDQRSQDDVIMIGHQ